MLTRLQQSDARHHLHPFTDHTAMHAQGTHVIVSGDGCHVTDAAGRRLLDGLAGLWCVNVGYNCRPVIEAVRQQMERLPYYCSFFNSTTEPAIRLADKLAALSPTRRMAKTFFSDSGSEANETALKLIRAYHKIKGRPDKTKILARTYAYHGVTIATTSLTGLPSCTVPFDLPLPGYIHVPAPYTYAHGEGLSHEAYGRLCLNQTRETIEREGSGTIAAMFVEPIQGAGGVIVPPMGYLAELRRICRENDILFVADEVISGFGRLGAWFASELWSLDPDFMTLAKGITSGYLPLGATMVSDEIADVLDTAGYLATGFTYSGHPTPCAAALANLAYIEQENLIARTRDDTGPYFQQQLAACAGHPAVGEVRGHALIGAIELLPPKGSAQSPNTLGAKAAAIARAHGVIVRGIRDLIAMSPPLTVTRAEIDELMTAVRATLDTLAA